MLKRALYIFKNCKAYNKKRGEAMIVYLGSEFHPDAVQWLNSVATVVNDFDRIEELDGIIIRGGGINRDMFEKAKRLKAVGRHGVGYDTIDVAAAKEHNVRVLNVPYGNVNSVAEMIVARFMEMSRNLYKANIMLRHGEVRRIAPPELKGTEITGRTLGLIGMGNIAQHAARMMKKAFDVKVFGYDPFVDANTAQERGIQKVNQLEELLEMSDLVSLSVALTPETRHMISGDAFNHFKSNAIFVNTSRGGIVNEDDLYEALTTGKLRAAAFDVFEHEPLEATHKLLALDNFSATPHIGGTTEEAVRRTSMAICENVVKVIKGEPAEGVVV